MLSTYLKNREIILSSDEEKINFCKKYFGKSKTKTYEAEAEYSDAVSQAEFDAAKGKALMFLTANDMDEFECDGYTSKLVVLSQRLAGRVLIAKTPIERANILLQAELVREDWEEDGVSYTILRLQCAALLDSVDDLF